MGEGILDHDLPGKPGSSSGQHQEKCRQGHDTEASGLNQDQKDRLPEGAEGGPRIHHRKTGDTDRRSRGKEGVYKPNGLSRGRCREHQQDRPH